MMLLVQTSTPTQPAVLPSQVAANQAPGIAEAAAPQLASIQTLQAREGMLAEQISILQGQRSNVVRQLTARDPVMRSGALEQLTTVDLKLANAQTELSSVRAQMRLQRPRSRASSVSENPWAPPNTGRPLNGDAVAAIMVTFTLTVLMPLSIAFSRRLWRRGQIAPSAPEVIAPRLDRLEQAVDAIAIEIERVSEGQRFVTKVMTERPAQARHAAAMSPQTNDASSLGEAKPFLALGAGPVEPIRVGDRQKVRQSNTPH